MGCGDHRMCQQQEKLARGHPNETSDLILHAWLQEYAISSAGIPLDFLDKLGRTLP